MSALRRTLQDVQASVAEDGTLAIADLLDRLQTRSWPVVLLVVVVPFTTPVPTMGLSAPFGLGAAAIGIGLALGRTPRLPRRVREARVPPLLTTGMTRAAEALVARLEYWVRPRMRGLATSGPALLTTGIAIAVAGFLLALPLPIPFSNALPAWTILFLAAGLLTEDGVLSLIGWAIAAATVVAFAVLGWLAWSGSQALMA